MENSPAARVTEFAGNWCDTDIYEMNMNYITTKYTKNAQ
jgi:hypothetical protein